MKTIGILLLILTFTLIAKAQDAPPILVSRNFVSLEVSHSSISINVPYPGPTISHICGIDVRSSHPFISGDILKQLAQSINVTLGFDEKNGPVVSPVIDDSKLLIHYDFKSQEGAYMLLVNFFTVNGKSLDNTFQKIFPNADNLVVAAFPSLCM